MKCQLPNYNKKPISNNMAKRNIRRIMDGHKMPEDAINAVLLLYDFMIDKNYYGGCHALSSALYVALTELGLSPELCVGECQVPGMLPFDHSWITITGEVLDIAVYYPLTQQINSVSGPVIFGIDIVTGHKPRTQYGIHTGLPLSNDTKQVLNCNFSDYMNNFPGFSSGLWTLALQMLPKTTSTTIDDLRARYSDVKRCYMK